MYNVYELDDDRKAMDELIAKHANGLEKPLQKAYATGGVIEPEQLLSTSKKVLIEELLAYMIELGMEHA
jgi:hypothetical protein